MISYIQNLIGKQNALHGIVGFNGLFPENFLGYDHACILIESYSKVFIGLNLF